MTQNNIYFVIGLSVFPFILEKNLDSSLSLLYAYQCVVLLKMSSITAKHLG